MFCRRPSLLSLALLLSLYWPLSFPCSSNVSIPSTLNWDLFSSSFNSSWPLTYPPTSSFSDCFSLGDFPVPLPVQITLLTISPSDVSAGIPCNPLKCSLAKTELHVPSGRYHLPHRLLVPETVALTPESFRVSTAVPSQPPCLPCLTASGPSPFSRLLFRFISGCCSF